MCDICTDYSCSNPNCVECGNVGKVTQNCAKKNEVVVPGVEKDFKDRIESFNIILDGDISTPKDFSIILPKPTAYTKNLEINIHFFHWLNYLQ